MQKAMLGYVALLVVLSFVLSGCASSRDTMSPIFAAPNVVRVCVRPPNVPKNARSWALTVDGTPLTERWAEDAARRNGLPVYVFDLDAPPESAKLLPIPYNRLACPARILPPPQPRVVVAAKVAGKK
ncbi:hypothetical protein [Polyangium sp. y55x31]|uniref:hypothetical protein n=1 Tax=Polyangium sp. y55x31 TaxID=3042688 RepID=UPI0024825BC9|nr:hypothetical protein [Polyangium sp. y55x31]MDI1483910.1 hypothetical protein [Polyangium sp. y55x31]